MDQETIATSKLTHPKTKFQKQSDKNHNKNLSHLAKHTIFLTQNSQYLQKKEAIFFLNSGLQHISFVLFQILKVINAKNSVSDFHNRQIEIKMSMFIRHTINIHHGN